MSITEKQNQDIIGRDQINNIEAILSIPVTPTKVLRPCHGTTQSYTPALKS